MKCIQILKDGKMDELNITETNTINKFIKSSKSQGINELIKLYSWNFEESLICCFGWYDGDNGFENTHDLPPGGMSDFIEEDSSEKIIYGDIFIVRYNQDKTLSDITISDYSVFYSDKFENFSNYDSDNDDCDYNDLIEIQPIVVTNDQIICQKTSSLDLDLDYDNYEY
jgi:hypothetical protein